MINARVQIKELLETVCDNVKVSYPEGAVQLPLITYSEITNTNVGKWQDMLMFQADIYANTFAEAVALTQATDDVMANAGWTRTYTSPDTNAREQKDLYHKVLNFTATVNTHTKNIISGGRQ